jgi:hypothetical protein
MNDERFFELAMKVIAGQARDVERAEFQALLDDKPELKAEFERLQADARMAKQTLPLVSATETTVGQFPAYARERLQTKVREALGRPPGVERQRPWAWKGLLVLAPVTVALVLLFVFVRLPRTPVIQVAMLDTMGLTRGKATNAAALLRAQCQTASVKTYVKANVLALWERHWPDTRAPVAKIVFDPASAEVRLLIRSRGRLLTKTFPVEQDLPAVLRQVEAAIKEELGRR